MRITHSYSCNVKNYREDIAAVTQRPTEGTELSDSQRGMLNSNCCSAIPHGTIEERILRKEIGKIIQEDLIEKSVYVNQTTIKLLLSTPLGTFRSYIPSFSEVTRPLTNLLKKNSIWSWNLHQQTAYDELKKLLTGKRILKLPNTILPFKIKTGSSSIP
ncbi:hypothetical protein CBL_06343 [Carabus blaptoides fortunei]